MPAKKKAAPKPEAQPEVGIALRLSKPSDRYKDGVPVNIKSGQSADESNKES